MELNVLRPRSGVIAPDPRANPKWLIEHERQLDGSITTSATLFLVGGECPFHCVFCDLWRHTLDRPTPHGALVRQIERGLAEMHDAGVRPHHMKLYNASNFFEPRAVPREDLPAIAGLCVGFDKVIVECHPRLIGSAALRFADRIEGRLEVAMGLETVHRQALERLDKDMSLDDYSRAARFLGEHGIGHRSFVLVGAPFVPVGESLAWTRRSVEFARQNGATHISLIPLRVDTPGLERLGVEAPKPPMLADFEVAVAAIAELTDVVVSADLWDVDRLTDCPACRPQRLARLENFNRTGLWSTAPIACGACSDA